MNNSGIRHPIATSLWAVTFFLALGLFACQAVLARQQVDVTTYHNNLARTGLNPNETLLTPANVRAGLFGRLFAYPVDGYVYAQPLYLSNVKIPHKGKHDIVLVATEHDSVYAFDADAASAVDPLWKVSFLDPANGVTTVPYLDTNSTDLQPEIGITGTPVIDRSTNTLYVVAKTKVTAASGVSYAFHLHALDVSTGVERPGSPVAIDATSPGTCWDAVSGMIPFNARREHDRMGLLLLNGVVYIPFASHGDNMPYHGWLLGYDAKTLKQVSAFDATPASGLGGFWEGAGAPTADSDGNIYLSTGNAAFDVGKANYGDSVLKMSTQGNKLSVADYFAPFNQQALDDNDADLGSGAIVLLPGAATGAAPSNLIVTAGKEGKLYLLDCNKLGGYDPATDHVVQTISNLGSLFACPAYFDGTLYFPGCGEPLEALSFAGGRLSDSPVAVSGVNLGGRVATPSLSSDGTVNGIVWIVQIGTPGVLYAFDARDIARQLYSSESGAIPEGIKFNAPTVANGRVFVGSSNCLAVFGLLDKATSTPPQPSGLTETTVTDSTVALRWSERAGANVAGYRIEDSTDGGHHYAPVATTPRDQTAFLVSCLWPQARYQFRVTATNSFADSKPSRSISVTTAALVDADGLVGCWPLDDGQGNYARDPIVGAPPGLVQGEFAWTPLQDGSGTVLTLHGTGNAASQVVVPDGPSFRFSARQSFTWRAIVSPVTPIERAQVIMSKGRRSPAWAELGISSTGMWTFAGPSGALLGGPVTNGRHTLIAVQDAAANTRSLYVDGKLAATGPAQAADGIGDLWIGASEQGGNGFKGQISGVRVYARALNATEVVDLTAQ